MKTATGLLLAATIGVAAAGCTSMTDLSSERVLDIQSTRVAAYIPAGTGQSSVSTYSSPTHAELSSERILDIHSTRAAAFIPTATSQSSAPTRAASTRVASTRVASTRVASTRVASTRASKTARSKSKSGKSSIHNLVGKHARAAGVPVKLALAVVQVDLYDARLDLAKWRPVESLGLDQGPSGT